MAQFLNKLLSSPLVGHCKDRQALLRNCSYGESIELLEYDTEFACCLLNPDKSLSVESTTSGTLLFHSPVSWQEIYQMRLSTSPVGKIGWSSTSRLFGGTASGEIFDIDVCALTESLFYMDCSSSWIRSLACNDNVVAWGTRPGQIGAKDRRDPAEKLIFVKNGAHKVPGMKSSSVSALAMNDRVLVTGGFSDGTVKVWDLRKVTQPIITFDKECSGTVLGRAIISIDLDPNGRIAFVRQGGSVTIGDVVHQATPRIFVVGNDSFHFTSTTSIRFMPDGNGICVGGNEGIIAFSDIVENDCSHLALSTTVTDFDFLANNDIVMSTKKGSLLHWKRCEVFVNFKPPRYLPIVNNQSPRKKMRAEAQTR